MFRLTSFLVGAWDRFKFELIFGGGEIIVTEVIIRLPQVKISVSRSINVEVFIQGWTCAVNHLVLIGFVMALKPLSAMECNPIKMTLTISAEKKEEGVDNYS